MKSDWLNSFTFRRIVSNQPLPGKVFIQDRKKLNQSRYFPNRDRQVDIMGIADLHFDGDARSIVRNSRAFETNKSRKRVRHFQFPCVVGVAATTIRESRPTVTAISPALTVGGKQSAPQNIWGKRNIRRGQSLPPPQMDAVLIPQSPSIHLFVMALRTENLEGGALISLNLNKIDAQLIQGNPGRIGHQLNSAPLKIGVSLILSSVVPGVFRPVECKAGGGCNRNQQAAPKFPLGTVAKSASNGSTPPNKTQYGRIIGEPSKMLGQCNLISPRHGDVEIQMPIKIVQPFGFGGAGGFGIELMLDSLPGGVCLGWGGVGMDKIVLVIVFGSFGFGFHVPTISSSDIETSPVRVRVSGGGCGGASDIPTPQSCGITINQNHPNVIQPAANAGARQ